MAGDRARQNLKTLETAYEVLDFVRASDDVTFSDVRAEFDLAKSTAHGYLATLEDLGLITKRDTRYRLGIEFLNFAKEARNREEEFRFVEPKVNELVAELGEGADFMVFENDQLVTLYHNVPNDRDPNFQDGKLFDVHNSAGGKAVLAELPDDEINALLDERGLHRVTENTITDRDELFEGIERIRDRGYAVCDEEYMNGVRSVGAVVEYPDGSIFGALGVGGPTYRLTDERLSDEIPTTLLRVADELERELEEHSRNSTPPTQI
ncbi:IclR family transcriptional regulator [Haloplanus pelagicus]|jgi:DNA-binding IclR family transcriptional regulator|uniref:IclR family transcriptional regulator n=1 Tax=Haloplanus pelagicus TaxID=2949995 RepID=UPI00203E2CCC|nr:IclR family transcriptional regulator [Haloplanus sp. HW8-1]